MSCEKAFDRAKPEVVVHSAALTNVDLCETNKEIAWSVNVDGTRLIAELCSKWNCFLVFISTDYVFDGETGLYSEEDKPSPINFYGYTKAKAEEVTKEFTHNCCIVRSSVIFGARPAAGKTNFALWVLDNLRENKQINVVTDQVNSPTLNSNLAEMILEVVERRLAGTCHLAGATAISRYDFAKLLAREFGLNDEKLKPVASKDVRWIAKRPKNSSLNVSRAFSSLKKHPIDINRAVKRLKEELDFAGQ